jgi:hypothetical protein
LLCYLIKFSFQFPSCIVGPTADVQLPDCTELLGNFIHLSLYSGCQLTRGRILGRNWVISLKSFPPCCSQSPLLMYFTPPPPPPSKSGLQLVCNVNIVYENLKSENVSRLCPETATKLYVHEFGFWSLSLY